MSSIVFGFMPRYCALFFFLTLLGPSSTPGQILVSSDDVWRYRKGTSAPEAGWKTADDSALSPSWLTGAGGFGYADNSAETSLCQTILADMKGAYSTVAMRKSFSTTAEIDPSLRLVLTMDFDDGFIAWLDGNFLTSSGVAGAPNEPAFDATATSNRESSRGDSSAQPPTRYDLGPVGSRLGPGTHVLAIVGLNSSKANSSDFIQVAGLELAQPPPPDCKSGPITADTVWDKASSPISVCGNVTVEAGATLIIEPGVETQFAQSVELTIADGGRLIAEGNETNRIRFTSADPGTTWRGIIVNGSGGSPETRIAYADFENNGATAIHSTGGTVFLDNLNFGAAGRQYISLDDSSFVVSHCYFPLASASFEPLHGTGGIKAGGHGIVRRNFFGGAMGYNDLIDFTGGNRPEPIVHIINNVFAHGDDDGVDLDGTDGWVEGNIFLHIHRNGGTPDSAAAVSGGDNAGDVSDITVVGNIFIDCDSAATAKQGNFYALLNNTIVHTTKTGGIDGASGAFNVRDTTPNPTTFARGLYAEGNIVWDAEELVRNYDAAETTVTLNRNASQFTWTGAGTGNVVSTELAIAPPTELTEAVFTNWLDAQAVRGSLTNLQTIANGIPGAAAEKGISIFGAPTGVTHETGATLTMGFHRAGFGIPTSGWPLGAGYTHYKWRLDGGPWSAETPIATPIVLAALSAGAHFVEAVGKLDSGLYQDDPLFGEDATVSRTATWVVEGPEIVSIDRAADGNVTVGFIAETGQSYSLEYRDDLDAIHPWIAGPNLAASPERHAASLTDLSGAAHRFYRLATPAVH